MSLSNQTRLARALGFSDYPGSRTSVPYLNYMIRQNTGTEPEEYIGLFVEVVEYFRPGTAANGGPTATGGTPASTNRTPTLTNLTPTPTTVQALIDRFASSSSRDVFRDTDSGTPMRKEQVEDAVMSIIGTWAMMLSSFQLKNRSRKVVAAYSMFATTTASQGPNTIQSPVTQSEPDPTTISPYFENVAGLIAGSGLLPGGEWDRRISLQTDATSNLIALMLNASNCSKPTSLKDIFASSSQRDSSSQLASMTSLEALNAHESQSIRATQLNAFTLNVLSAVNILWTPNVSRHMLLTKANGRFVLELFSLPCAFDALTSAQVGLPVELRQEIQDSYAILFNAWSDRPLHAKFGKFLGLRKMCWCWSCSAHRFRYRCVAECKERIPSEFDPRLQELMSKPSTPNWTPDALPMLWPRIARLEQHLQTSRPWNLSVLFRDRRDTMQFWTFFFATMVVLLTIVQVILGVAQVVGSFK